jgi:perosamine synthetase
MTTARTDVRAIVEAVAAVVGDAARPVHLHEPRFAGHEWDYVKRCIDEGWVSSAGAFVGDFERRLASACGTKAAVALVNGTAALHVALRLNGVKPGDEVILPSLTFIATANAVAYCGAVPHFVDIDPDRLGIDPVALDRHLRRIADIKAGVAVNRETGRAIRACVPVHVFGHPADMDAINRICAELGITVIEDATESLGSLYRGRPCGGLSHAGVLSFNGNKIVTTGGGGAIVTNDLDLAARTKHLTTTAKLPHRWAFLHDETGWNYRLPNINAALGVAQLEALDGFVAAKRRLALRYAAAFGAVEGVRFVNEPADTASNYWLNAILLDEDSEAARDEVLEATHAAGLLTRPAWTPMHQLPMFAAAPRADLAVTETIHRRLINLPSSAVLGME